MTEAGDEMTVDRKAKWPTLEGVCSTALLAVLFLVILLQVSSRLLSLSVVWTEELSRWIWVWMVCFGICEAERTSAQLSVDVVTSRLSPRMREAVGLIFDVAFTIVVVELLYRSWVAVLNTLHRMAVTLPLPRAAFYGSFAITGLLLIFRLIQKMLGRVRFLRKGEQA